NIEFSSRAESEIQPILPLSELYLCSDILADYCNDLLGGAYSFVVQISSPYHLGVRVRKAFA
ncbi:MAG: hypothetical protein ABSD73_11800, partial [Candidatus Bathyarchaeia archaeon]